MAAGAQLPMNFLGKSGLKVSNLCLGTMTFGTSERFQAGGYPTQSDEEQSHQIMDRYIELGGNFLDTANIYTDGNSEKIIGTWLKKQQRERIILATKARGNMDPTNPNKVGLSRRHLVESCEESLKRLQTDYIDLFQTHCWDIGTPIEETLRTLDDLVRAGKIRYFGVSNVCGWQLQKIVDTTKMLGLNHVVSLQQQYNLLCRQPEWEEFMVCQNEGLGVLTWSPLKGGVLTGKFKRGETPSDQSSRIGYIAKDEKKLAMQSAPGWSQYKDNNQYWNLIELMGNLAKKYGKSIPAVALRWLIQQEVVSSVIIGATSLKQLEDNMSAGSGWQLEDEEIMQLSEASPRATYYPYEMIWRLNGPTRHNPFNHSLKAPM